jgi:pimeloyl-ACP methyl ester carboxylesterase
MTTATGARSATRDRAIAVWQGQVTIRVRSKGSGPALVFFHGPWGLVWDPFLDELARRFTVYAPEHPGTTPDAPDDALKLDGLWDLVLCYDEVLAALGLERAVLVGHSFGAMVAAELAAAYPARARRLVLIDPIGFWLDTERVVNWMMLAPAELPRWVFRDPESEAARRLFGGPGADDPATRIRVMWTMGATGKFIWPLPDKGLKKRIHRVTAPTLVVWGTDDRLVPAVYADEFVRRLPGARLERITAGHAPHAEQPEAVSRLVTDFSAE